MGPGKNDFVCVGGLLKNTCLCVCGEVGGLAERFLREKNVEGKRESQQIKCSGGIANTFPMRI